MYAEMFVVKGPSFGPAPRSWGPMHASNTALAGEVESGKSQPVWGPGALIAGSQPANVPTREARRTESMGFATCN